MEAITAAFWSTQVSLGTVYKPNPKGPVSAFSTAAIRMLTSDTPGHLDGIVLNGSWVSEIKNLSPLIALGDAQVIPGVPRGLQRGRGRSKLVGAFPGGHSALMLVISGCATCPKSKGARCNT
jgi:hypothetical protein